jgi:hypothetical protein
MSLAEESFSHFSWQMAELLASAHMVNLGFTDARTTQAGADGGIDIVSSRAAAQVKFLSQPVGSPDIQRLRGAAHGYENALFYSYSGYSKAAFATAEASEVALFDYTAQNTVFAANESAEKLSDAVGQAADLGDDTAERALAITSKVSNFLISALDNSEIGKPGQVTDQTMDTATTLNSRVVAIARERQTILEVLNESEPYLTANLDTVTPENNSLEIIGQMQQFLARLENRKALAVKMLAIAVETRELIPVSEEHIARRLALRKESRLEKIARDAAPLPS